MEFQEQSNQAEWSETALDWFQRSQKAHTTEPTDPTSAAWSFVSGSTGIAFLDATLKKGKPALLELTGNGTWTLISLAARFVVATRQSRFPSSHCVTLPHVVLMDPLHNILLPRLISAVRGTLLLQGVLDQLIDQEIEDCLARIHLVFVHDTIPTVAALEALRLNNNDETPTLVLWDSFLTTIQDATSKQEVVRQVMRLWRETNVLFVASSHRSYSGLDDKHVTCRIRLEQPANNNNFQLECKATVNGTQIPYKIGTAGVISYGFQG